MNKFATQFIQILHYMVNKQDVSVLTFQKRVQWTPHNEDDCFVFLHSEVLMLSNRLWGQSQFKTGFYFNLNSALKCNLTDFLTFFFSVQL